MNNWKRINRKVGYESKFVTVFEDEVELPNGTKIPDYTVVKKPDFSMIVATDPDGKVVMIKEYKYAINQKIWTLPAGHIESNETILENATKELREETGYIAENFEELGILNDYPSKDCHSAHIIRARNITPGPTEHEATESISSTKLFTPDEIKQKIKSGEIHASGVIAALALAGILF
ncbi:MAG: NUDIX hydrolase [Candidatus Levybacteria bacterium]|nr:NUDIX hydrolase [Candidatus Levybacteria bacterium]